jgi:hypothetical protein
MLLNDFQPSYFPSASRILVIGDIHGDVQTFMKCLYAANIFNTKLEWIAQPRDTIVVQLGDQVDSMSRGGNEDWETVPDVEMLYLTDRLDTIARMQGGRVLSLLGNHELMNVTGDFSYVSPSSARKIDPQLRQQMFRPGGTLSQILAKRNVILRIGHHIFCHGGILPHHLDAANNNIQIINDVMRKFLRNLPITSHEGQILSKCIFDQQGILWSRLYVEMFEANKAILEQVVDQVLQNTQTKHIYVGHNTVQAITPILNAKIIFTDVGLSRAYPMEGIQMVEILNVMQPNEEINIMRSNSR